MGALVLAMLTDGMAFFSNTVSGIESIVGFGIAAGIAVMSSFIIMGIFVPLVFMRMDARRETGNESAGPAAQATPSDQKDSLTRRSLGAERAVAGLARRRLVVLPVAVAVTGAALIFAIRLPNWTLGTSSSTTRTSWSDWTSLTSTWGPTKASRGSST